MEKIVYILGAGFSAPLGLPVMSNFFEKSKDIYFLDKEKYGYFDEIFDTVNNMSYCKTYYDTDLLNIEEILSILEMKDNVIGNSGFKKTFIKYLCDVIEYFTPEIIPNDNIAEMPNMNRNLFGNQSKQGAQFYGYFVCALFNLIVEKYTVSTNGDRANEIDASPSKKQNYLYSVITLNYDMILENLITYFHSKDPVLKRNNLHFNRIGERYNEEYPWLVKLHGSVDTGQIIPPTWNKFIQHSAISEEWKKAYELLKGANHIRIIGYSLPVTDSYIKYLLRTAIIDSENKHLKSIDIICKDYDGTVQKRYESFIDFKNMKFTKSDCINYMRQIYNSSATYTGKSDGRKSELLEFKNLEIQHNTFMNMPF